MKRFSWFSCLVLVALQGLLCAAAGGAEPPRTLAVGPDKSARIAVVIGNGGYRSGALANPRNDAIAMAAALKKLGFDVELKLDATKADMDAVFKRFSAKAEAAGVAALFYAGHGVQVNGSNYIVPIDANPKSERDLKREMLRMDDVIDDMGGARVKLVFFDACRDNPLTRSFSRGGVRGMAAPVEATGTLISFATKHGNTAADGEGKHSPYTTALLAALEDPAGVEIEQMLRKVQQGVKQATNGQQEPWRYGSLDGDFYFQAPAAAVDSATLQQEAVDRAVQEAMKRANEQAAAEGLRRAAEQQARDREAAAAAVELSYWDSIKSSRNADDFRAYVRRYPKGSFVDLAQNRVAALTREEKRQAEEARTAAQPAAAPVAGDQAIELAFWESIKNSNSVDDLKEYLASYPQGRFAGLARNRIRSLDAAAPKVLDKPVVSAASPAAAQAPTQVAMIAPSKTASVPTSASAFPQTGDSWIYRYVDGWKKNSPQTIVVKVQESEGARVTDVMSLRGGRGSDERTYEGKPEVSERAVGGGIRIVELLPYLQSLLLAGLQPGQEQGFPDISLGGETYRIAAKLVGREKVSVPAGSFDAWRLDIVGQRIGSPLAPGQQAVATVFRHALWFVPEIRRVVRVEHTSGNQWRARLDDDSLELVSSVVSGQAQPGTQGQSVQTAEIEPSKLEPALASTYPQAGDSWTYRYVDGWKKNSPQTIIVKVQESDAGRVTDRMSMRGGRGADERTYEGKPDAAERPVARDVRVIELLPYAQGLLQAGLQPGQEQAFPDLALGGETYRIKAKLIGPGKVSVPAGVFDALRVDIVGQRLGGPLIPAQQGVASMFMHTLWFAPEIRRVVKVEHVSGNQWRARIDDDTMELVSFTRR